METLGDLFWALYRARNENDLDRLIENYPQVFDQSNWFPLGGNESNFGVVENQQSNPVAALVEKITNSIDAILMRKCYEAGIDPKSSDAPRSVEEAIEWFFPEHRNWDLSNERNIQAENIEILADSYPGDTSDTSLVVYDDGEGQHPEDFEATFLSLLRGNKNEIHFVQGKYNMGGSGAIAFCGRKRYQLIASKRYDGTDWFGFTLIRKHPLSREEAGVKKNTWYEYLKIDDQIPAFNIDELDLGLHNRLFRAGTIVKLYSYELKGNRHIRRDLGRSLNEFLYEPALPIYLVETPERYPNDRVLTSVIFGLKRQLLDNEYVETTFSEEYSDQRIGQTRVTVHVFKARAKGKNPGDTKKTIRNEYFKNNMSVLFSVNGQVHGHYTTEFISRTLKFNLLKEYLLIHVDCTDMRVDFRNELFMASRDRLKQSEESSMLREMLGRNLSSGQLKEIYKRRKDNLSVESSDDEEDVLRSLAENLPISSDLRNLLSQTFKLDGTDKPKRERRTRPDSDGSEEPFYPNRYPSFFQLDPKRHGNNSVIQIPLDGSRTVNFDSDVENQYFDRVEDPGELRIAVMTYIPNDATGGNKKGTVNSISDIFSVNRRSPNNGKIKVVLKPSQSVKVGDQAQVKVDLTAPGEDFSEIFWVKIIEPQPEQKKQKKVPEEDKIGLPKHVLVYQSLPDDMQTTAKSWDALQESGIDMGWEIVMHPITEGDVLETVYINMDSTVLKDYKAKKRNLTVEQSELADRRYISSVYFHTLFLYAINRSRKYRVLRYNEIGQDDEVDLTEYLRDVFGSHYASFLLNFGTGELMEALD